MKNINLELKVLDAKQRIKTFLNEYGDKTYLSFSGGKDSTVVAHLIKEVIRENKL